MIFLKKDTAVKVPVGPCVDATDGATLETAIAWATGEAQLIKHDAAAIVNIGTNTWSAHLGGGMYNVSLTASDTDTLGALTISAHDAAMRPVRVQAMVLASQVWDSLFSTDLLQVDATQINGNATSGMLSGTTALNADMVKISGDSVAADNLEESATGIVTGTVSTGSTTTRVTTALTEATNDHYNGRTIVFVTGNLAGQAASITDYNGAAKELTVSAMTEAPANGDTFVIV